jgi:hypothetical protein
MNINNKLGGKLKGFEDVNLILILFFTLSVIVAGIIFNVKLLKMGCVPLGMSQVRLCVLILLATETEEAKKMNVAIRKL